MYVEEQPGFNIRLAKEAHRLGIPVVYYISPQVWAWKKGRLQSLAMYCRRMLTILPFEKQIYEEADVFSIHVPLTDETRGMVGLGFLSNFKKPIPNLLVTQNISVHPTNTRRTRPPPHRQPYICLNIFHIIIFWHTI